jgi:hypothetical protein
MDKGTLIFALLHLPTQDEETGCDSTARKKAAIRADRRILMKAATHPRIIYEILFFVFSFLSAVLQKPLLSVFGLLDMCFWSGSRTAIDAIRFNIHKMGQVRTDLQPHTLNP